MIIISLPDEQKEGFLLFPKWGLDHQGEDTRQPEIREIFGLEENKDVASVVIVGNHEARIAGIYPGKGVDDLPLILRIHPNIIKQ